MNHENGTSCCISSFWFWFRWPSSFYKAPEPHISSKIHCSCLVNMKYKAIFVRRRYDVQQRLRHHSHPTMLNMAMIDGSTHATLFGCLPNLDMCHRRSLMIRNTSTSWASTWSMGACMARYLVDGQVSITIWPEYLNEPSMKPLYIMYMAQRIC